MYINIILHRWVGYIMYDYGGCRRRDRLFGDPRRMGRVGFTDNNNWLILRINWNYTHQNILFLFCYVLEMF